MPEPKKYMSIEAMMYTMAAQRGVDTQKVAEFYRLQCEEETKKSDGVLYEKKLEMVERLVWEKFFPEVTFLGSDEAVLAARQSNDRQRAGSSSMSSIPGNINAPWSHDMFGMNGPLKPADCGTRRSTDRWRPRSSNSIDSYRPIKTEGTIHDLFDTNGKTLLASDPGIAGSVFRSDGVSTSQISSKSSIDRALAPNESTRLSADAESSRGEKHGDRGGELVNRHRFRCDRSRSPEDKHRRRRRERSWSPDDRRKEKSGRRHRSGRDRSRDLDPARPHPLSRNKDSNKERRHEDGGAVRLSRSEAKMMRGGDHHEYRSQVDAILKELVRPSDRSEDEVLREIKQKTSTARQLFADQGAAWQQWYAESVVWQNSSSKPFPGREPRMKKPIPFMAAENHSYASIERHMEGKAVACNQRRAFFQYLNTARLDANRDHAACTSDARHCTAELQTWKEFWPSEPYPVNIADGHRRKCVINSKLIEARKAAGLPAGGSTLTHSDRHFSNNLSDPDTGPAPTIAPRNSAADWEGPRNLPANGLQLSIPIRSGIPLRPSGPRSQFGGMQAQSHQDVQQQVQTLIDTASQLLNAGPTLAPNSMQSSPYPNLNKIASSQNGPSMDQLMDQPKPPVKTINLLLKLQQERTPGTIIIINESEIPCAKANLVNMVSRAIGADHPELFGRISATLRCFIHFHKSVTGDLIIWTMPRHLRDTLAMQGGEAFMECWVMKVLSGQVIKPSTYWAEFTTTASWRAFRPHLYHSPSPAPGTHRLSHTLQFAPPNNPSVQRPEVAQPVVEKEAGINMGGNPILREMSLSRASEFAHRSGSNSQDRDAVQDTIMVQEDAVMEDQSKSQGPIQSSTNTPNQSMSSSSEPPFVDKEQVLAKHRGWGDYLDTFKVSEMDALIMEGQIKAEAGDRMVLDEETGEVISLKYLIPRIIRRSGGRLTQAYRRREVKDVEEGEILEDIGY